MKNPKIILKFFSRIILSVFSVILPADAQVPQAISYQAVARNNAGNILVSQLISLRFTIRDNTLQRNA
jgi:hypothetical protein